MHGRYFAPVTAAWLALLFIGGLGRAVTSLAADNVRLVQRGGVTFRETSRIERKPVVETGWEEQAETTYKEHFVTELRDQYRPVQRRWVEYRHELRRQNWWNPLAPPQFAYQTVPVVRWETRMEKTRVPVTYRKLVPETRMVRVATRTLGFEPRTVVDRVALLPNRNGPASLESRPRMAESVRPAPVVGIRRIENDPARQSLAPRVLR